MAAQSLRREKEHLCAQVFIKGVKMIRYNQMPRFLWALLPIVLMLTFPLAKIQGYQLFFLVNEDFDSNIGGWYTCLDNRLDGTPVTPGTVEWSSDYGGSAHMTVSGAPSYIGLLGFTNTAIYPGDTLRCRTTHTEFVNANLGFWIGGKGGEWNDFCEGIAWVHPAGTYDTSFTVMRFYPPGAPILIYLVTWPGSGEAWFHYVQLHPATGILESKGSFKPGSYNPTKHSKAYPVPTTENLTISFELPFSLPTEIKIFDCSGSLVKELKTMGKKGTNLINWNGSDNNGVKVGTGVYYYKANAGSINESGKIVVTK